MPVVTVLEADGTTQTDVTVNDNGRAAAASSAPMVLATEDLAAVNNVAAVTQDVVDAINATGIPTVAHDAVDSGDPLKIGGRAVSSLSGGTNVAAADRTDAIFSVDGAQFVRHVCLGDIVSGVDADTDGSSTAVIAAQAAGVKVYVTDVMIANSSASNVTVDLRDGAAGAVKATFPVPANGGVMKTFATPLPFSAATAVCADPSAAATTITTTLVGFISKI